MTDKPQWLKAMMVRGEDGFRLALWQRWGLVTHRLSYRAFRRAESAIDAMIDGHGEVPALILASACNFLFLRFDFAAVTWEDAPDDLLERITGSWHPQFTDPRIEVPDRYQYVATVLGLTAWPDWPEIDPLVRKIALLTFGEPLGADYPDQDDQILAELLYDLAWRPVSER